VVAVNDLMIQTQRNVMPEKLCNSDVVIVQLLMLSCWCAAGGCGGISGMALQKAFQLTPVDDVAC